MGDYLWLLVVSGQHQTASACAEVYEVAACSGIGVNLY
ncbi:MAG: hypothetical protein K0R84_772, partial [Clostridia bacterium]|nr:hypothetical protein [Clostridia bacterium]